MKKAFIATSFILLGPSILVVIALVIYFSSIPNCNDTAASNSGLPIYPLVTRIGKFDVTVTGTQLRPGQTFVVEGDGRWFSNATLLVTKGNQASFLLDFYDYEREEVSSCIWHVSQ